MPAQQGHRGVLEVHPAVGKDLGRLGDDARSVVPDDGDGEESHLRILAHRRSGRSEISSSAIPSRMSDSLMISSATGDPRGDPCGDQRSRR